jgi:hypothetical protein
MALPPLGPQGCFHMFRYCLGFIVGEVSIHLFLPIPSFAKWSAFSFPRMLQWAGIDCSTTSLEFWQRVLVEVLMPDSIALLNCLFIFF